MKSFKFFTAAAAAPLLLASCVTSPKVDPQPKGISKADVDSASYTFGVYMAQMVTMNNLGDLNLAQVLKGYKDCLTGKDETLDQNFVNEGMSSFMEKRQEVLAVVNLEKGAAFLEKNGKEDGVITTESGLQYKIVRAGNGVFPTSSGDTVTVNYEGTTIDGKVFDSSYEYGEPTTFPLGRVIPGWVEGLMFCDEGSEVMLYIPSDLAYGMNGPMGPNQVLIFKVELLSVESADVPAEE